MSRIDTIRQMLTDNPSDSFLRFALAKEFEKTGDDAAAIETYRFIVENDPDYVGTYYHLGKALERSDEPQLAWTTYSDGISVCRRKGEKHAMAELAGARLELGDEEDFE